MLALLFSSLLLAVPVVHAAAPPPSTACPSPASTDALLAALDLAEAAYADADLAALEAASARAAVTLPCLADPVSVDLAARYHRVIGLQAFVEGREEAAERSFAASRALDPSYRFPPELVPEGNPVLDHYRALPIDAPKTLPVPAPAEGTLLFDGVETLQRPLSWPSIVQLIDDRGVVLATAWVEPTGDLPAYRPKGVEPSPPPAEAVGSTADLTAAPPADVSAGGSALARKWPWVAGSAAMAVTTGTLFVISRSAASTYHDPATTGEAELSALRNQANGLLFASAGTAVLSVGLGAVAIAF